MLTLVKMVASKPLFGDDYGRVVPGQEFVTNSQKAEMLESKGLAYRAPHAKAIHAAPENKMLTPREDKSAVTRRGDR